MPELKLFELPYGQMGSRRSNEANLWINEHVSWQNCWIWDGEQCEKIGELSFHPEKTKFWCGLCACGIVDPYFFKNYAGKNVTVNVDRYCSMISDYLIPEIEAFYLGDISFKQDGATFHTSHQSMDLL